MAITIREPASQIAIDIREPASQIAIAKAIFFDLHLMPDIVIIIT